MTVAGILCRNADLMYKCWRNFKYGDQWLFGLYIENDPNNICNSICIFGK